MNLKKVNSNDDFTQKRSMGKNRHKVLTELSITSLSQDVVTIIAYQSEFSNSTISLKSLAYFFASSFDGRGNGRRARPP